MSSLKTGELRLRPILGHNKLEASPHSQTVFVPSALQAFATPAIYHKIALSSIGRKPGMYIFSRHSRMYTPAWAHAAARAARCGLVYFPCTRLTTASQPVLLDRMGGKCASSILLACSGRQRCTAPEIIVQSPTHLMDITSARTCAWTPKLSMHMRHCTQV